MHPLSSVQVRVSPAEYGTPLTSPPHPLTYLPDHPVACLGTIPSGGSGLPPWVPGEEWAENRVPGGERAGCGVRVWPGKPIIHPQAKNGQLNLGFMAYYDTLARSKGCGYGILVVDPGTP